MDAKRDLKSLVFWSKIDPRAPQGRLYLPFGSFLGEVEKSSFFDEAPGRRKINKNRALGAQGPPSAPTAVAEVHTLAVEGPRAPRARYYKTTKKQAKGALSNTPLGRWPGEFLFEISIFWHLRE